MMKKWTAALLACMMLCMCASGAMAASKCSKTKMPGYKSVFYESFEKAQFNDDDSFTLENWFFADRDNNSYCWYPLEFDLSCHGNYSLLSDSLLEWTEGEVDADGEEIWYCEKIEADNWLISPELSINPGSTLTFRAATYYSFLESFEVYIDVPDGKDTIFDFDTAKSLGEFKTSSEAKEWRTYGIEIPEDYHGKNVRFAFRHHNPYSAETDNNPDDPDRSSLMLDCVHLWEPDPNAVNAVPSTGDDSNIALWIGLMAISFLGAAALSRKAKKAC